MVTIRQRSPKQIAKMQRRDVDIKRLTAAGESQSAIGVALGLTQSGVGTAQVRLGLRSPSNKPTEAPTPAVKRRAAGGGRKPAGPDGVLVRNLPGLMLRLTPVALSNLKALSVIQAIPIWRLVDGFVTRNIEQLTGALAEDVRRLAKHELARIRADYPGAG